MTGPDAIALAQHQQARQFNVAGADLLEEIYAHLCAVHVDLLADRIDAEHITSARDLALIAWRAQRALAASPQHALPRSQRPTSRAPASRMPTDRIDLGRRYRNRTTSRQ